MKPSVYSAKVYNLSEAIKRDASAVGVPDPQMAAELRQVGALVEVLEQMPTIVCLIGSTRFFKDFADHNLMHTLRGRIVLSIGCDTKRDGDLNYTEGIKHSLDVLHMWKIILADVVICLNRDQYIGKSTARELGFATLLGRPIEYLEPVVGDVVMNFDIPPEVQIPMALAATIKPARQLAKKVVPDAGPTFPPHG